MEIEKRLTEKRNAAMLLAAKPLQDLILMHALKAFHSFNS